MVMAAAQTTTLAVTLHHMLGADHSPVTGSCPSSRSQSSASGSAWSDLGCVVTLLFVVFTDWDILSLHCTAHWEWPEKWLAAAAAPSLGPLCTGAAA